MSTPDSASGARGHPLGEVSDDGLIRRIQAGDEEAFPVLFRRYEGVLRAKLREVLPAGLRRKVSASDLLQETRIVALRRCIEFHTQPDGTFRGWLLKILNHKVRDAIRNYKHTAKRGAVAELERGDRPDTSYFVADQPSPSEFAMAKELRNKIQQAINALPEDYQEVLRLTRLEGLTLREAADRMGRTREATKKLYGRALTKFGEVYGALGGGKDV